MTENYCENPVNFSFKPHGTLAKIIFEKHNSDKYLKEIDKNQWYNCDLNRIPKDLAKKFIQLGPDKESNKFLEKSEEKSDWILTQLWHCFAKAVLGWFMTQTSINGWLQRGSMYVLSLSQFLKLIKKDGDWHKESFIDLGAGDGGVTSHLAPLFNEIYVTEVSEVMRNLLRKKGFSVLEIDDWDKNKKYDMIACLNLLDRCDTPIQLLKQIKNVLKPNGYVLLGLVLPFSAYVEIGSKNHLPKELLPIIGDTFEEQVTSVVEDVLKPIGFEIESWTRVPYLCEGDLRQSYYWLDDVVFILKSSLNNVNSNN